MARTLWKGAISFSLIHIPVSMEAATRSNTLDLDLLDRRDFAPVGYQRVNKNTGKAVEWDDIVKAYQHSPGEYVVLTDEDFRLANVEATQTIDVQGFTPLHDIPPAYFETPYHLKPDARGLHVYELFLSALEKSGLAALALVVIRTRQHPCALYPHGPRLMLNTLRFSEELIEPDPPARKSAAGKRRIPAQESSMALKLIEEMRQNFDATAFRDTYREDLLKRIEQKARKGQAKTLTEPSSATPAPRGGNVVDLTSLLRRSLEQRRGSDRHVETAHVRKRSRRRAAS